MGSSFEISHSRTLGVEGRRSIGPFQPDARLGCLVVFGNSPITSSQIGCGVQNETERLRGYLALLRPFPGPLMVGKG